MSELLSIIVANYNNQRYLKDCISSIFDQTYHGYEIVVADDCSTDDSTDIIREYEEKYPEVVRAIYHTVNHGVSANRQSAIVKSRGTYITTLDSDDYYFNRDKLANEMEVINYYRRKYQKKVCSFSNTVLVDEHKNFIQNTISAENLREGNLFEHILTRLCAIPRDFIMLKSEYINAGGFDLSLKLYEDWDLKIRLASQNEFYYTGTQGTAYRRHGRGLSAAPLKEHINVMKKIFDKNIHLAEQKKKNKLRDEFDAFLQGLSRS